ncbi:DUF4232 domain-containing protein [Streptomyces sp. NPDC048290]|uniref:DUF4232 domain-containing protein n=1 Tax=Streptomyces sp. NPDC048290 TaxID=3155811 RepID=UPI00344A9188
MTDHRAARTRPAALALAVAALALTACGGGPDDSAAVASQGAPKASPNAPQVTAEPAQDATQGSADTGSGMNAGDPVDAELCAESALTLAIGASPKSPEGGQNILLVELTNDSGSPCTVSGFPVVTLKGPDHPVHGPEWELLSGPDTEAPVETVRIPPGQTAAVELMYLTDEEADAWIPSEVTLALPHSTNGTTLTAAWPAQDSGMWATGSKPWGVMRQDAATHPGTFTSKVFPLF